MNVEWCNKAIIMKYCSSSDGQDNHMVIDCGLFDAPASTNVSTSAVGSVILLPPSVTKPPGPSHGKCEIDS